MLKSKGIDLNQNRFLILQGEVEQISLMKPKGANPKEEGLLEYLEDIIGSNIYVPLIQDIDEEVEGQNDVRIEQTNRVKASQQELKSLETEKRGAAEFIFKERECMKL